MLGVLSFVLGILAWLTGWGMTSRWVLWVVCFSIASVYWLVCKRPSLFWARWITAGLAGRWWTVWTMLRSVFFFFLVWSCACFCVVFLYLRQYALLCSHSLTSRAVRSQLMTWWRPCVLSSIYQGVITVDEVRRNQQFVGVLDDGRRVMVRYDRFEPQIGEQLWVSVRLDFPWRLVPWPVWQRPFASVRPVVQETFGQYEFDYTQRLMLHDIVATTRVSTIVPLARYDESVIPRIRRAIAQRFDRVFGDTFAWALYAGLLIGDTSWFGSRDYEMFRDAWLVHVVAVSGGHIVVVLLLVWLVTRFLPFYLGLVIKAIVVWWFVLIAWAWASIVRAWLMAFVSLVALMGGRMVSVYRLLGITSVIMIAVNPQIIVVDVWFLLSFAAVFGIVLFGEIVSVLGVSSQRWWGILLHEYVFPCIGASLGVLPVLLFFMGTWNALGIVSNIVLAPFVSLGMVLAWLAQLVPFTWWIAAIYQTVAGLYADSVMALAHVTVASGIRFEIVSWSWRWAFLILWCAMQLLLCAWFTSVRFDQKKP